jgi:hypothetical protein
VAFFLINLVALSPGWWSLVRHALVRRWLPEGLTHAPVQPGVEPVGAARRARGGARGRGDLARGQHADGVCARPARLPGKRAVMLALLVPLLLPPELRHPAGDRPVRGADGGDAVRRHTREPHARGAVRRPRDDPVRRADRPEHRVRGTDVRGRHRTRAHACAHSAADPRHPRRRAARARAHGGDVRADVPAPGPRARRCWSRSTTPRSLPVSAPTR